MTQSDKLLDELRQIACDTADCTLARTYAPQLRFDVNEPFFPLAVGYTIFRREQKSPSSKFVINPQDGIAIEYAIWWDWDIQHLYELEHVWVYLDTDHNLLRVEASAHGSQFPMFKNDGSQPLEDGRITLYSEPGKHGFVAEAERFEKHAEYIIASCGDRAGEDTIHTSNPFGAEAFANPGALEHRLAKRYMQSLSFTPHFKFSNLFDLSTVPFVRWDILAEWIPRRIIWWCDELRRTVPQLKLICLDSGDTLVDEATEVKNEEVVERAELIPGAEEMVQALHNAGYSLALVADGPRATFENVLKNQYGLWDYFSAFAISEDVGVLKPDAKMFLTVLDDLSINEDDYQYVVMVGNHLGRDIQGANELGLISIWMNWSPRRSKTPANESQIPDYTIKHPSDLLALLETIDLNLLTRNTNTHG